MKKVIAMVAVMSLASVAMAVPYASGVSQTGTNVSFILNQAANVQVVFDGGAQTLDMGAQNAGSLSFDMAGYSSWEITCSGGSAGTGFVQISDDSNINNSFYIPTGVAVNRNPASPYFGSIYVAEAATGGTTGAGRPTSDGIYIMGADSSDITGQGNTPYDGGLDWTASSYSSPHTLYVAPDNNVYIADWSDGNGGVWRCGPQGQNFAQVLANDNRQSNGLCDNHGSVSGIMVEGVGENTKLLTMDEDFNRGMIHQYDIGTATEYAAQPSAQLMDNTQADPQVLLNGCMNFVRDPRDGSFWVAQYRSAGNDTAGAPTLTRFIEGGTEPIYNSGMDDDIELGNVYGQIDISEDGKYLVLAGRSGTGARVLDISDPTNPIHVGEIEQLGHCRDVAFDAAGNIYITGNSSESLKIWSPEGAFSTTLSSCGDFTVVPEPASLALLALGGLALIRRR